MFFEFHAAKSSRPPGSPSSYLKIIGPHKVTCSPTVRVRKSFSCNTYGFPRKCCKQKTYGRLTPLDATLTKNRGVGGAPLVRSAYPSLRRTPDTCHPEANRRGSLKDLIASFKLSCSLTSSAFPICRQGHRTLNGAHGLIRGN